MERVDLAEMAGPMGRLAHRKRWQWAMVSTPEVVACFAIVDAGYAASAFAVAADLGSRRVVADVGALGSPISVTVGDRPAEGARSRFTGPRLRAVAERVGQEWVLRLRSRRLMVDARLDSDAAPPLTVIAPVTGGRVNVTQKAACLPVVGSMAAGGRRYELDGGLGGLDYTHGLLARRTSWRWAFGCGRTEDGRIVGFNVAEGFNESEHGTENALWLGGDLVALAPARFTFDPAAILTPWQVVTEDERLGLAFNPVGQHRERRNILVARSRLSQVVGTFSGTVDGGHGAVSVSGIPGVSEDQDVIW